MAMNKNDPAVFRVAGYTGRVLPEAMQVVFSHKSGGGACVSINCILDDSEIRPAMERAFKLVTGRDAPKFGQTEAAA